MNTDGHRSRAETMKANLELDAQVALLCGWKKVARNGWLKWKHPSGTIMDSPPKFHADLNACAEFEKAIPVTGINNRSRYEHELLCIRVWTGRYSIGNEPTESEIRWGLISATPIERCKAFLHIHGQLKDYHA